MKKIFMIVAVVSVVALALGAAGYASAQGNVPPQPGSAKNGALQAYIQPAIAEAFSLTVDELNALHDSGTTIQQYAEEQGMSAEEIQAAMQTAFASATNAAVADGVITQEQADFMQDRMAQRSKDGFGPGSAGCDGNGSRGGGQRGSGTRWPDGQ
ncbi:MAG: hypothetical protein U9Q82_03765 [Chloroflexota bacterium]|nr:hypothetical protein [Chloroflexota bacterium]